MVESEDTNIVKSQDTNIVKSEDTNIVKPEDTNNVFIKLKNEIKAIITNINMAKLLKDKKLLKVFNKDLKKKHTEMKQLQKELTKN